MYDHAKDRTQLLPAEMDQDYNVVLDAAHKRGFDGSKILIVGSPGSGKTYSLKSLISNNEQPEEEYDRAGDAELHANEPDDDVEARTVGTEGETQTVHSSNGESMTEHESLAREAESNGQIIDERQIAYLRGETNNIEEATNENINS